MKKRVLLFLLFIPVALTAQQTKAPGPVVPALKPALKGDTVIEKNVPRPGLDYWSVRNASGFVKMQGAMSQGQKEGTWREYGGNNNVLIKIEDYTAGRKNGASVSLSMSGMVLTDETYRNDTLHGRRMIYSNSARLKTYEHYKLGILEGERKTYYDDGKIQEDGFYKNGQREGLTKWFMQNGNPSLEYTYKNGLLEGPAKVFDEKGAVKQEGQFSNNVEEGEWIQYESGTAVKKLIYKNGSVIKELPIKK